MPEYKYPGYGATTENWLTPRAKTKGGYHGGSDNPAKPGTPVYAQHGGEVFRSGNIAGYGMSVVVKSTAPDGTVFYQLYGHLGPDQLPAPGTPIAADQPIPGAVIGTKDYVRAQGGLTSGPHLHREIISGKAPLNADPNKPFGIYSSDITHKADPDAFDIDRPVFPYQNGEPKPPLPSAPTTAPPRSPQVLPSLPGDILPADFPRQGAAPPSSSGMAIPGAKGPTSLGGRWVRHYCGLLPLRARNRPEVRHQLLTRRRHRCALRPRNLEISRRRAFRSRRCWRPILIAPWINGPRRGEMNQCARIPIRYPPADCSA